MDDCYICLGGNVGSTLTKMQEALLLIENINGVSNLSTSRVFLTSAVSDLPQGPYLNAVVKFQCSLDLVILFDHLETIEKKLGKKPKNKNEPRIIDLDLLFYGEKLYTSKSLKVPHPSWHLRAFMIYPLCDVAGNRLMGIDLEEMKQKLRSNEIVIPLVTKLR